MRINRCYLRSIYETEHSQGLRWEGKLEFAVPVAVLGVVLAANPVAEVHDVFATVVLLVSREQGEAPAVS